MLTRPRKQKDETKAERILIQAFNLMQTIIKNTFRVGVCVLCPLSFSLQKLAISITSPPYRCVSKRKFQFFGPKTFQIGQLVLLLNRVSCSFIPLNISLSLAMTAKQVWQD